MESTLERSTTRGGDGTSAALAGQRRRRIIIPVAIVVVLIGLVIGIRYLIVSSRHVTTDDAQITGNVTNVAAKVRGQVIATYVHDNETVHKGQLLAQIDPRDYQVVVAQAQAAYDQAINAARAAQIGVPQQATLTAAQTAGAQSQISQAQGAVDAAQAKLDQASAALTAAQAALTKATQDRDRARLLVSEGAIPQSDYDAAQAAYVGALANRNAASQGVDAARAGVAQAQALVQAGSAQLEQAQTGAQTTQIRAAQAATQSAQAQAAYAALQAAKLQLSYTMVKAPIDGVVSKKAVNVGDTVAAGQPLMAIADQTHLLVVANLKETQLTRVRAGQPVDISVDAYPKQHVTGHVESLSPATGATFALLPPDNATGNFTKVVQRVPVRIVIDPSSDPQHLLRQGLSVEVNIDTSGS